MACGTKMGRTLGSPLVAGLAPGWETGGKQDSAAGDLPSEDGLLGSEILGGRTER